MSDIEEDVAEEKRKVFRAKCKLILITIAIVGFFCQIVLFPILTILSSKYAWGIEFPQLELGTIAGLLCSLF